MITFIDEKGTEHSTLVAYSMTNAVNGELSVKGTIYTNDKVLHGIDRGWRFRLDDEYYRVTYAKPNDAGRQIEVEFDAVHQFFYDMSKSMVYDTLNGSKPFETYLQAIFSGSGYTYNLETTVGSIRKENFGNKSRLSLFNDIIKAAGLEFSVRGHVVRILKRIGTDLSAIVRKDFNMNELKIEKNINSFVTYQRGLGAWKDDEDHSKGRYESEYESPLAKIYGRIEAEPVVDERYKETGKLLERLKENVDKSYKVSVEIDMEDLSRAGYRLSRPNPGDYIMAINETLGFRQKVRIVSFTSEYDVGGNLISRKVVCNDIGSVQRQANEMSSLARSVQDVAAENAKAIATATKALVSADGKNTIYFSESKPRDEPVGTLRKGDQLYLKEGEKTNLYFWNGAEWELNPLEMDIVKFRKEYESKTKEINQSMATQTQQTAQALRTAGANASAIEAAKGAITKLNQDLAGAKQTNQAAIDRLKSDFASAQQAASDQTALLRSDLTNIRTKQSQAESEIAKQVSALNTTKTELAGMKSAQATYEQTTTRRLAELSNLADGKASRSEVAQTAEELKSRIASVETGSSRNYFRNSRSKSFTTNVRATYDHRLFIVPDFWQNKDRLKRDYVRLSFDVTFPVALARDMPAMVHFGASPWYAYRDLVFKGGTTERQHFEFTIDLSGAAETYQANNVFIRFGTNYGFPAGLQVVIENAMLSVSNYYPAYQPAYEDQDERVTAIESTFKQRADSLEAGVNRLTEGLKTKADSSALTVLSDSIKQSVKSLESDVQNKLDSKLSTAEFEVRASGIRQEILNATKDKADKTLVVAEAGKLREEFSKMKVGSRNYAEDYDFSRGLWIYSQGDSSPVDWKIISGEYNVKGTTKTWKQMQIHSKEGSRLSWKSSTALLDLEIGETYTLSFQGICYSGSPNVWISLRANRTAPGNPEIMPGHFNLTSSWQTYQVTIPALTKPDNFDFWRIILGYSEIGHVAFRKVELTRSSTRIDAGPAPEDGKTDLVVAKSEFEKTAEGLSSKLATVETYVSQDGQRQEALLTHSREETARQLTAERKLIESGYVAKAQHAEDVRGLTRRFEELKTSSETKLAEYRQTVEGQFATISSQISGKANQTDFQRVQETSKLYERLIGSTEKEVADKVSRMALSNELFQVEVSQNLGLRTVQYQIANAWAVQHLNSNGDIISQINATGPNVRIQGESIHLDGRTLIDNGVIKNAMIESMLADKITAGTLNAANVNIVNLNANKIVGLDANFIKSKIELAFIEWMKGKTISAQNDAMQINLNDGHVLFYNDDASIKRVLAGYPTQFIRYENKVENGQNHGRTIIGSNRNGTNAWKSVSFAGLVIDNNSNNSVDKIYQFGDYNHMRHAQGDDGWNFSVVTQTMTPGVWNKNSEIWARHFVVPRNTKGDTDSPTQFIRLEESVAAIWNILNHAASGQVTMTQAMKNLINSRKAAWDIVRNVG